MTTQDILMLSFVISKEAAFCRGESDWWPPRDDEIRLVKTLFDEGSCIDYLSQGEKVRPVAMKLRKALREFLDCAADEMIGGNPKAMTVKGTVPFCEAWINWIDTYFPPVGAQAAARPGATVKDFMLIDRDDEKERLLKTLHTLIDRERGKGTALAVLVCMELGLMRKPAFSAMLAEFPGIGSKQGFDRYFNKGYSAYRSQEIDGIRAHLVEFQSSI